MNHLKIKKNDTVVILSGKDKNKKRIELRRILQCHL